MADDKAKGGGSPGDDGMGAAKPDVEAIHRQGATYGIMMGGDSPEAPKPTVRTKDGHSVEIATGGDEGAAKGDDDDNEKAEGEEGAEGAEPEKGEGGEEDADDEKEKGDEEEGDGEPDDLGDYDPSNDETVAKFDTAYMQEDGTLSMEALSKEWWRNAGDDPDGGNLNEATYDYLKDRFGLPKETIKHVEAGQVAQRQLLIGGLHERAGGKASLDAALEWGRGGGYTEAQAERFNTIMASGDTEAMADAVDAIVARYSAATGKGGPGRSRRRPLKPQRTVVSEGQKPRTEGFADREAYRTALRAAGDNMQKVAGVNRKLRASTWFNPK